MLAPIASLVLLLSTFAQASPSTRQGASTLKGAAMQGSVPSLLVGTALNTEYLHRNSNYTSIAGQQFSIFTPENEMKWEYTEPQQNVFNFTGSDEIVNFALSHGAKARGHTFVWQNQLPPWVNEGLTPNQLDMALKNHIDKVMGHYKGKIFAYDIVNEAIEENGTLKNTIWSEAFGLQLFYKGLTYARAADPQAKLCINDYNIEGVNVKSDYLYNVTKKLLADKVPLDCIGLQSHFILNSLPPNISENMKRFADLGLDIAVTELDIRMDTPGNSTAFQQQSQQYAQVIKACKSIGAKCISLTTWGFSDATSWIPGFFTGEGLALEYDANYTKKPAYNGMRDALAA